MSPQRRDWLRHLARQAAAATVAASGLTRMTPARAEPIRRGRTLAFPADHGAHPDAATEWWYATGWQGTRQAPALGFQATFFRSRTGLAEGNPSRFAARQLLFAHAAVTALGPRRHVHDQRIVRWTGAADAAGGSAQTGRADVAIGGWRLRDDGGNGWHAVLKGDAFDLDLQLARTQPLLLQGEAGFSRKGPQEDQASHYYSEPQLAVSGRITLASAAPAAGTAGQAWLDHEWSDHYLHPEAVGWDWLGINLFDGSALTAFVLRRRDGSALWAGGSFRATGTPPQTFAPAVVQFTPGRRWRSPASGASYPVTWQLQTPAGRFGVSALLDAQELDSRGSTGTVYWEGLSELLDGSGRRIGLGYLEMTGYAAPLAMR